MHHDIIAVGQNYFDNVVALPTNDIMIHEEVRQMCQQNRCQSYGKNWTCPPGIGDLAQCKQTLFSHDSILLLQTIGEVEDSFDYEGYMRIETTHNKNIRKYQQMVAGSQALGAGACRLCATCTYPAHPCRHPKQAMASIESYGIIVSELCKQAQIPYYYHANQISYFGLLLLANK